MSDEHLMDVLTRGRRSHDRDQDLPAESNLPDPSRGYEPFSRPSHHPVFTLHCVLGRDGYRSFQYSQLDSDSSLSVDGQGQVIRLRFYGSKLFVVTVRGRNLWRLYDYIHQHKISFVMAVDPGRDFADDGEPVVTSIDIKEIREAEGGQPA